MVIREYDMVFVGGGLAALLLLRELGPMLPERVAIIDPYPPRERPSVHWSYWSHRPTPFDRYALAEWRKARVAGMPVESIAPFVLRLVCSTDVLAHLHDLPGPAGVEWLPTRALSIASRSDGLYDIVTEEGLLRARWVFDSAPDVSPVFPSPNAPRALESGTGVRVAANRPVFDATTANLLDPLDAGTFVYLLPLSPVEALIESACFGPFALEDDQTALLRYLKTRHPDVRFTVTHAESGRIPLGFAPRKTAGPRHILLGTKRGLIKPSAGYGIMRIAKESEYLARLWREGRPLPPSRRSALRWRLLDTGFLQLAVHDPRLPLALLERVMGAMPLAQSLRFIDEEMPLWRLLPLLPSALPVVLRKP